MHIFDVVLRILGTLVTLGLVGWGCVRMLRRSYNPLKIVLKVSFTLPFAIGCIWFAHTLGPWGPFLIVFMGVILSIMWTPHIGEWLASPITGLFDGGHEPPDRKPVYSIAKTKRNRGKPHEAIIEIRRQLEQFPNDFEGIMFLARVQAEDLNDLPGAEVTLNHFCDQPEAPERQAAAALTQLADWQMKIADVDSARAALQKIITKYPGTETALQAEQRIAHLVETEKVILKRHDDQNVVLNEGVQDVGLLDSSSFLQPKELDPGKLAGAYVKHLEAHPHDIEVREKLATIYARHFKRLDLATLELAQLINEPKHKPKQIAHWLNLLANFQVELGADIDTVRTTLQKIVESFPDLPVADLAQNRLARLKNEFRGLDQPSSVKLGSYEQNIGLKYGRPGKK